MLVFHADTCPCSDICCVIQCAVRTWCAQEDCIAGVTTVPYMERARIPIIHNVMVISTVFTKMMFQGGKTRNNKYIHSSANVLCMHIYVSLLAFTASILYFASLDNNEKSNVINFKKCVALQFVGKDRTI